MKRIISGITSDPRSNRSTVTFSSVIECDETLYEDEDALIQSFYNFPEWHNLRGEIVAIDSRYPTHYDSMLKVWTQRGDCDCGNYETREEQYEKDEPQEEPICAWHEDDFQYKDVTFVKRY
jgi:hypothetical protein